MISKLTGIAADSARGAKNLGRTMGMDLFYKFLITSHLHEGSQTCAVLVRNIQKCGTSLALLGGGLEPRFRVLLSAIFHGFPSEIAIRVENGGFWRKQNCCKLLQVYVPFFG
jgi:hypothetical protein